MGAQVYRIEPVHRLKEPEETFSYTFTANASKVQLIFYAGQSGKDVYIDDVVLK